MSARRFPRRAPASTSLLDVKMLTWSLLKRSFGGKKSHLFKFSAIPVICGICFCIMMFVSEVTFQSNEASVTTCERCDKFSLIGKKSVDTRRPRAEAALGSAWEPGGGAREHVSPSRPAP